MPFLRPKSRPFFGRSGAMPAILSAAGQASAAGAAFFFVFVPLLFEVQHAHMTTEGRETVYGVPPRNLTVRTAAVVAALSTGVGLKLLLRRNPVGSGFLLGTCVAAAIHGYRAYDGHGRVVRISDQAVTAREQGLLPGRLRTVRFADCARISVVQSSSRTGPAPGFYALLRNGQSVALDLGESRHHAATHLAVLVREQQEREERRRMAEAEETADFMRRLVPPPNRRRPDGTGTGLDSIESDRLRQELIDRILNPKSPPGLVDQDLTPKPPP